MTLPNPEQVKSWGGKLLVDRTGQPIGTVAQVYTDDATGLPEWATTRMGEAAFFLPLQGAVEAGRADPPPAAPRRRREVAGGARPAAHHSRRGSALSGTTGSRTRRTLPQRAAVGEGPPRRGSTGPPVGVGAAATARRRLADPPTITLTALAAVLAGLLWATLRRANQAS